MHRNIRSRDAFGGVPVGINWSLIISLAAFALAGSAWLGIGIPVLLYGTGGITVENASFASRAAVADSGDFSDPFTCATGGVCTIDPTTTTARALTGASQNISFSNTGDVIELDVPTTRYGISDNYILYGTSNIASVNAMGVLTEFPRQPNNAGFREGQIRHTYWNGFFTTTANFFYFTLGQTEPVPAIRPPLLWFVSGTMTCQLRGTWATSATLLPVTGLCYSSYLNANRVCGVLMPGNGSVICSGSLTEYVSSFNYP